MAFAYLDLDSALVFRKLLCNWLFPDSLDDIFTSRELGELVMADRGHESLKITNDDRFSLLPYRLTRNNNVPRMMGIPHPLWYVNLCSILEKYWDKIDERIWKGNPEYSNISKILPTNSDDLRLVVLWTKYEHRLINRNTEWAKRKSPKLKASLRAKFIAKTDISQCFPNMYSHAISWALVWKTLAKRERGSDKWFNKLDTASRWLKNNETNGLPIWPDSSHIISEIILSQIDKVLYKKYSYTRHIDDYACHCKTREEAESFIKDLSAELWKFQLQLNDRKTQISPLPESLSEKWIRDLRRFDLPKENCQFAKCQDFLDIAAEYSVEIREYSPFKYAVKRISNITFKSFEDHTGIFSYICSVAFLHPYIIDSFDDLIHNLFVSNTEHEDEIRKEVAYFLSSIITEHVQYNRSDVVTISLYLAVKYQIQLNDFSNILVEIIKIDDPIPMLLAFEYSHAFGLPTTVFFDKLQTIDQQEWWLYVYQLFLYDESAFCSQIRIENMSYRDLYSYLKEADISFIRNDWSDVFLQDMDAKRTSISTSAVDDWFSIEDIKF